MRQAILITAYRDLVQLQRLTEYFDADFEIFIHLDKKCHEKNNELFSKEHVHVSRHYNVEWGDYKHLEAIVTLMRSSFGHTDLEYFHLITGSDWPCLPLKDFKEFCGTHRNNNFVEHFPLPHADWGSEGGLNRIQYWWIRPNTHRSTGAWLTRRVISLQRKMGIKRSFNYFGGNLYGGGTYWSVSREAVGVALEYMEHHPDYLRRFRWTSIAEEICLPTLWLNSGLSFVNDYKRYIDWGPDGANPQVLTEKDYDKITASGALFARKMESGVSDDLIKLFKQ